MSAQTLKITGLGAGGDGIADSQQGTIFVPFACPGDTVKAAVNKNHGELLAITEPSVDRVEPQCPHFGPDSAKGACGGCSLQHVRDDVYVDFKRDLVVKALRARKLDFDVAPLVKAAPGERRRAVFAVRKTEKNVLLGFHQAGSHHIVSIDQCPVISPAITERLDDIRKVAATLAIDAKPFRLTVLETMAGLDIAAQELDNLPDAQRRRVIETVLGLKSVARLSLNDEIIIEPRKPSIRFGETDIVPPPGSFTQATERAEEIMASLVLDIVGKSKAVADLFCGSGTFALRLAQKAKVHAVEADAAAIKALDQAARAAAGLKPLTHERRDLFRRPLIPLELKKFDAVVFDPPRAGAEAQARELARTNVKKIVAVSCNPVTLARDLSILVEAGYRITSITPIDQFLWSSHVEVVAGLEKTVK